MLFGPENTDQSHMKSPWLKISKIKFLIKTKNDPLAEHTLTKLCYKSSIWIWNKLPLKFFKDLPQ